MSQYFRGLLTELWHVPRPLAAQGLKVADLQGLHAQPRSRSGHFEDNLKLSAQDA